MVFGIDRECWVLNSRNAGSSDGKSVGELFECTQCENHDVGQGDLQTLHRKWLIDVRCLGVRCDGICKPHPGRMRAPVVISKKICIRDRVLISKIQEAIFEINSAPDDSTLLNFSCLQIGFLAAVQYQIQKTLQAQQHH